MRTLLHFTIGSLSIAGGVILLVLAVWMVLGPSSSDSHRTAGKDPMRLAQFPLAVPYLLNPVGIVGLMTISAEAESLAIFAVELGILAFVLVIDVVVFRWANRVSDKLVTAGRRTGCPAAAGVPGTCPTEEAGALALTGGTR